MLELDALNPTVISKWSYLSNIVLDACACANITDCQRLLSSIHKLSEPMGIYGYDLHRVFKEDFLQEYFLKRIRFSNDPETIVDILQRLEVGNKPHLQAMVFYGVIVCQHIEVFGENLNSPSSDSDRIP
jgi:hypothetical protein